MRVMTVLGTRPELIKLSEIIKKLDKHTDHTLVHTNQNYDFELSEIFYKDLGLRYPDMFLNSQAPTLGGMLGNLMRQAEKALDRYNPHAVVILGDTNSGLAGILAKRRKIPLFHLEAGNRCFDDNVPEEINRRLLDHISDVNMVYTETQRRILLSEGLAKDRTLVMGSPMNEVLNEHLHNIVEQPTLRELGLRPGEYFLVSIHRDENTDIPENLDILLETLEALAETYKLPIMVSTHPRLKKRLEGRMDLNKLITLHKPFGFYDYIKLQLDAKCVLSDSGTISEESSILGFPAITIRNAIERTEAIDTGSILMTGVNKESIFNCVKMMEDFKPQPIPRDYNTPNTSERVLRAVLGLTPYVNRYVWHK